VELLKLGISEVTMSSQQTGDALCTSVAKAESYTSLLGFGLPFDGSIHMPDVVASGIIVSAIIAIYAVQKNASVSQNKAAIDILNKLSTDKELQEAAKSLRKYAAEEGGLQKLATEMVDSDLVSKRADVILLLNFLEDMAVGVKRGIYDLDTVRECRASGVVTTFMEAYPLIDYLRHERKQLKAMLALELLARTFDKNNVLKSLKSSVSLKGYDKETLIDLRQQYVDSSSYFNDGPTSLKAFFASALITSIFLFFMQIQDTVSILWSIPVVLVLYAIFRKQFKPRNDAVHFRKDKIKEIDLILKEQHNTTYWKQKLRSIALSVLPE
jgi:hypothetical protein